LDNKEGFKYLKEEACGLGKARQVKCKGELILCSSSSEDEEKEGTSSRGKDGEG